MPCIIYNPLSTFQARENRAEREALQELVMSREKENQTLTSRLAESQDAVSQLKQLVENHVASEREKNKRVSNLDGSRSRSTITVVALNT